jgi:ribosomal protein S18 acetylase RimI-like enzyme
VASSLLAAAEERARRHGLASVALETSADNAPARALYESLGFSAGEERRPQAGLPGFVAYVKRL